MTSPVTNCSICFSSIDETAAPETISRPCSEISHVFHKACIDPWLVSHNTCPICRRVVTVVDSPAVAAVTSSYSSDQVEIAGYVRARDFPLMSHTLFHLLEFSRNLNRIIR